MDAAGGDEPERRGSICPSTRTSHQGIRDVKRPDHQHLSEQDRILWSRVARTAKPLPGKSHPQMEHFPVTEKNAERVPLQPLPRDVPENPAPIRPYHPRQLEAPTREKLVRGRISLAGRVDLHGLTQNEAHTLLFAFLSRAFLEGRRYVLVITGKGSGAGGAGVLRRAVPQWLSSPSFSTFVSAYGEAGRRHGGSGALYVRLRKRADR